MEVLESMRFDYELSTRGQVAYSCASIESVLSKILMCCEIQNDLRKEAINFRNMQLSKKIKAVHDSLKLIYPSIWENNLVLFERLKNIVQIRNQMAHCLIEWDCKLPQTSASKIRVNKNCLLTFNFNNHEKRKIYGTSNCICT
jgi:hypothetical protein